LFILSIPVNSSSWLHAVVVYFLRAEFLTSASNETDTNWSGLVTQTDAALAEMSRRGERWAFEELVQRTARAVFAHLCLQTGDPFLAEDLTQETYLSAWRSIRSLADAGAFRGWLFTVANSVLVDSARRNSRQKRSAPHGAWKDAVGALSAAVPPDEKLQQRERQDQALAALRQLPEEYRQVLTLRYLGGADHQTIARQLAITNGSLRGLLSRGLKMLRERLKD
jgi:RNA polymerase sigma-70 factor (ECF subfamily)